MYYPDVVSWKRINEPPTCLLTSVYLPDATMALVTDDNDRSTFQQKASDAKEPRRLTDRARRLPPLTRGTSIIGIAICEVNKV